MKNEIMLHEPELSFESLHQELNNFLHDTFNENIFAYPLNLRKNTIFRPAIELKQNNNEYKIKAQLPGVDKENIDIDVNNDYLTISATIEEEKEEEKNENEKTYTCELKYGKFMRTIGFENPIKPDETSASYKNGILTIILPKQRIEKPKNVKITVK